MRRDIFDTFGIILDLSGTLFWLVGWLGWVFLDLVLPYIYHGIRYSRIHTCTYMYVKYHSIHHDIQMANVSVVMQKGCHTLHEKALLCYWNGTWSLGANTSKWVRLDHG